MPGNCYQEVYVDAVSVQKFIAWIGLILYLLFVGNYYSNIEIFYLLLVVGGYIIHVVSVTPLIPGIYAKNYHWFHIFLIYWLGIFCFLVLFGIYYGSIMSVTRILEKSIEKIISSICPNMNTTIKSIFLNIVLHVKFYGIKKYSS